MLISFPAISFLPITPFIIWASKTFPIPAYKRFLYLLLSLYIYLQPPLHIFPLATSAYKQLLTTLISASNRSLEYFLLSVRRTAPFISPYAATIPYFYLSIYASPLTPPISLELYITQYALKISFIGLHRSLFIPVSASLSSINY